MANTLKVKRSATPAKVPTTTDLELGEIAVNTYDGKMFIKKDNGTQSIVEIGTSSGNVVTQIIAGTNVSIDPAGGTGAVTISATGGSGGGDVSGPASSTNDAITRYDGTTGKLIQNSTVTLDDNGNFANINGITFDITPTNAPSATGAFFWDDGNQTPSVVLNSNTSLQLGQENIALVYNGSGSTIIKGSVVAVNGAQGQRPSVVLADADTEPLSAATLGIAAENIANGSEGFICTFGLVRGIDTSAFTAGDDVYLSQTAGQFTATRPNAPAHTVFLGWVISVNASSGELFVNINNGWELDELHNVLITSPASGNTLIYDASVGVWKNANLTDGAGINITEGAGSITIANAGVTQASAGSGISLSSQTGDVTITNTAPDQVVSISAGTGISTSGTYPSFTVTNSAPDQIVSLTGTGTTSVTGTYPNFTINSEDQYDGTVTSVNLTAGTGISVSGGPITSNGSITVTNTAPDQVVSLTNGSGISITGTYPNFTITNTGGGGGGGVTSITAGTGLTGGTITESGTIAIDSTVVTMSGTQTLTNKTITPRSNSISSGTTIAPTANDSDQYSILALDSAATIDIPTGTPTNGQKLTLRIKDNGSNRALTWVTSSGGYRAIGVSLPTTTAANKVIYVGCIYNSQDTFWDVVAVSVQA